jgi:alpha-N-arabinofuranosidase
VGSGSVQEMMEWVEYMTSDADSTMANLRRQNGRDKPWELPYFGVGNESWGCGGNMRPEYYADLYRRYSTFVKNYSGNNVFRIACGASDTNYDWTEVLMSRAGRYMNGLSLHYYTIPTGNWGRKGSATEFDESVWHATLRRTLFMDELIAKHSEIMDRYDSRKRVGLVIDEWGIWTDVQPGTNPGFLYQQNTLRDALLAALNFHIFHRHADRVTMTNIAQTINVLQAMILTDGPRMLRTPTFHVFEMFQVHQDGTFLPVQVETPDYTLQGQSIPSVSASATRDEQGRVHLSLVNTNPNRPASIRCELRDIDARSVTGRQLTAPAVNSHNTFDEPNIVAPGGFDAVSVNDGVLQAELPAKSVVMLTLQP